MLFVGIHTIIKKKIIKLRNSVVFQIKKKKKIRISLFCNSSPFGDYWFSQKKADLMIMIELIYSVKTTIKNLKLDVWNHHVS